MRVSVFAFSRQGCRTARRVMAFFHGEEVHAYTMERFGECGFTPIGSPSRTFYEEVLHASDAMVFVGSVGIAVREIAPHIRSKTTDPAVLSLDELGTFVIPLLSGHIGGANDLARSLAEELNATPVITTATDIHQKFSVDAWAAKNGYVIGNLAKAKAVSAEILENPVPLCSDFPVVGQLPGGVVSGEEGPVGICISIYQREPFAKTLRLIPPVLHLGIGCRKGTTAAAIHSAVETVLKKNHIDPRAVKSAASIDLKAEEEGLLQFCREKGISCHFYTAKELNAVAGNFTPSDFVRGVTGVDNVCERAAWIGAEKWIVRKTAGNGVTVAVAAEHWEVRFE